MQNTDKIIIAHNNDIDSLWINLFSPRVFIPTLTFGRARDFPFALVKPEFGMTDLLIAYKQQILNDFNNGPDYENEFHKQAATRLVELAKVRSGQLVLDIATGTGLAAIAEDALRSIALKKISVAFSTLGML